MSPGTLWTPGGSARGRLAAAAGALGSALAFAALSQWLLQLAWLAEKYGWPGYLAHVLGLALAGAGLAAFAGLAARGRLAGRLGASSLRWTVVAVVAGWAVYFALNERYRQLELATYTALGLGVVGIAHLAAARWPEAAASRSAPSRVLELVAFSLAVAAIGGELALRAWGYLAPSQLLAQDVVDYSAWVETQRRSPGSMHFGTPCDAEGNYDLAVPAAAGPERPEPLVVSIGDSFSLGVVPHAFHFTTVAERELGRGEVYNVGIPGAGPPHYLYLLRTQALPLRPDAVVVNLFLGNDVDAPGQPVPRVAATGFWFDRARLMLLTVTQRLVALQGARRAAHREGGKAARPVGAVAGSGDSAVLESHAAAAAAYPHVLDPLLERPTFRPRDAFLALERKRAQAACGPEADYAGILDSLERIVAAAEGTRLAFVLIPDEFQVSDELWEELARGHFDRFLPQRIVSQWLDARGVPYVDLLPILRAQEPLADGRLHLYHLQDTHFNARGNAVAGRALAALVEDLLAGE